MPPLGRLGIRSGSLKIMNLPELFHNIDVHTHKRVPHAIVSVEPGEDTSGAEYLSVGIHPWHADGDADMEAVRRMAMSDPRVIAIGECGIDRFHGPAPEVQLQLFEKHIRLSEELGLPLIIHCVRAYGDLIELHRRHAPRQPWIIHGFRGKPQLAADLVRHGMYLSLGRLYNLAVPSAVPACRLLHETDGQPPKPYTHEED